MTARKQPRFTLSDPAPPTERGSRCPELDARAADIAARGPVPFEEDETPSSRPSALAVMPCMKGEG